MTVDRCDISKTFKIRQDQQNKLQEVEKVMATDQSHAFRLLLEIGYAGFTAVRDPSVISMKDDSAGLWDIPLLADLSPEAREATFAIWEKELGNKVSWIRRKNEELMKRREKDYETILRTRPLYYFRWGSGEILKLPHRDVERMIPVLETNLSMMKTYAGMQREYELRSGKRLPIYGYELSQHSKQELFYLCSEFPGHEVTPNILAMAKNIQNKKKAIVGVTT